MKQQTTCYNIYITINPPHDSLILESGKTGLALSHNSLITTASIPVNSDTFTIQLVSAKHDTLNILNR